MEMYTHVCIQNKILYSVFCVFNPAVVDNPVFFAPTISWQILKSDKSVKMRWGWCLCKRKNLKTIKFGNFFHIDYKKLPTSKTFLYVHVCNIQGYIVQNHRLFWAAQEEGGLFGAY